MTWDTGKPEVRAMPGLKLSRWEAFECTTTLYFFSYPPYHSPSGDKSSFTVAPEHSENKKKNNAQALHTLYTCQHRYMEYTQHTQSIVLDVVTWTHLYMRMSYMNTLLFVCIVCLCIMSPLYIIILDIDHVTNNNKSTYVLMPRWE